MDTASGGVGDPAAKVNVDTDMSEGNRKRLERAGQSEQQSAIDPSANQLAIVPAVMNAVSPPPKRDPKRAKSGDGKEGTTNAAKPNMAGSGEGRRRAQ